MHKAITILAILCVLTGAVSCKDRKGKSKAAEATTQAVSPGTDILAAPAGEAFKLSRQEMTSREGIDGAFDNKTPGDYLDEPTPLSRVFFEPEEDIGETPLSLAVTLRYNYCAVMNMVMHGYEWFQRISSAASVEEDITPTRQDTLLWISRSQPGLADAMLVESLPNGYAVRAARRLVSAYKAFDGNDAEGTPFYEACRNYNEVYGELPAIVTQEELGAFEEGFWEWYDKEQFVPGITDIIKMNMKGSDAGSLSDGQVEKLALLVKGEKDIDRRTILALELMKFDGSNGSVLLGDILESGIYTRYLLEAWISWRAGTQMEFSTSSFSVIPNRYYDLLRVKCLNTMLRHCQAEDDFRTRCLMENLILCEPVHRMGSIVGNSSFTTSMDLSYGMFINPELIPK